jgi:hypothetical protein
MMATIRLGDYEKIEILGRGGQGEVWKLRRKSDGRIFAGKFRLRGQVADDKIVSEAEMLRTLDHPGLVKGYGIGLPSSPKEPVLILMEYMDGPANIAILDGTLKSILLMSIAKALAYLHSQGIVHLDLKPSNILVKDGKAKLGDFGSAKLFGLASATQTSIALTQSYGSPDALNGEKPSPAMDVYSFAVIASELATGKPVFDPTLPPAKLMMAILGGKKPPVPSSVAPALKQVIERGWATDPKQRPTMAEVCETLAGAGWCLFPGANAKAVGAGLSLPTDAATSPATLAVRVGKLEEENANLKSRNAALQSEVSMLKKQVARLPGLEGEVRRLRVRDALVVAPVQSASATIAPGTLLAENAQAVESLPIELKAAELHIAKGSGPWDFGEFKAKVVGRAPLLVIVEFAGGVCGGFAAVPFEDEDVADPTGASFVFSLRPTAAWYPLKDKAIAVYLGSQGFSFGNLCLGIHRDGNMYRAEKPTWQGSVRFLFGDSCLSIGDRDERLQYAVPSGWKTDGWVRFARLEVWRVTL